MPRPRPTPIGIAWAAAMLLLTALWCLAEPALPAAAGFMAWRHALVNLSGIVALGAMALALLLATRPVLLEPALGGLDKMYRLHKWLGITALVVAGLHWLCTQAPHWLVALGWLQRGPHRPAAAADSPWLRLLQAQRGLAEGLGEWAFYAAVLLIGLALSKRFPYHRFFASHRLLALVFLVLAWHGLVLMPSAFWRQPPGLLMALLMAGGSVAALRLLFRQAGCSRRAFGTVERVHLHATMQVLEVGLRLQSRWPGHRAGQFAFVRFDADVEPHPFTLSSAWRGDGRLLLLIKNLGDATASLPGRLHVGSTVRVEGPYGQFNFSGGPAQQIWIGAGIGITPFIARLQQLALQPDGRTVDLFHAVPALDADAATRLAHAAQAAGVQLHLMLDARDGRLSTQRLQAAVPNWQACSVWFCGPAAFGQALRRGLCAGGLPPAAFHQELFQLR